MSGASVLSEEIPREAAATLCSRGGVKQSLAQRRAAKANLALAPNRLAHAKKAQQ